MVAAGSVGAAAGAAAVTGARAGGGGGAAATVEGVGEMDSSGGSIVAMALSVSVGVSSARLSILLLAIKVIHLVERLEEPLSAKK